MQEHIIQFFAYEHLPPHLQAVSKPFGDLARLLVSGGGSGDAPSDPLPRNPERTVALRKLLEAKDAAVRALLAKDVDASVCPKCGRPMVFSAFKNSWECSPCREPTPAIARTGNT